jgi:predicted DNA-binding transcriptional regulator YafY
MGSDGVFRDSTVRNLEEIVDLLPGLNLLDDPDLEAMRLDVKARLAGYDPKDLRKDTAVRAEAAREANEIMERMAGFMSAFGGE